MDKKFKSDLVDGLTLGLANRFDHKKHEEGWSMRDVGVYGVASLDIVEEHILPIIDSKIKEKDEHIRRLQDSIKIMIMKEEDKNEEIAKLKKQIEETDKKWLKRMEEMNVLLKGEHGS